MLLAGTCYDPTTAVSQPTTALLAMTALDTTNLRLTFVAPPNGNVLVRLKGNTANTGAVTTFPRIMFGILDGATVRFRQTPMGNMTNNSGSTGRWQQEVIGLVTGLTPGNSYTWDAAYGVDIAVASTAIQYGGPNDAVGADAWGGFVYEIWDTPNLLAGKLYDPAAQASKADSALQAMTAMDTANLRLTFIAPISGNIMWRIRVAGLGQNPSQILLGMLSGATVVARVVPILGVTQGSLTTTTQSYEGSGVITGLTPGNSYTYDAAWAVQLAGGSHTLKWGGPDDAVTNNAVGGVAFEIWAA